MDRIEVKRFSSPDERRPFVDKGYADVVHFGGGAVGKGIFEPGWRWSKHVQPIAGTRSCEAAHSCYCLAGRMHIVMDDGDEVDVGPGDVVVIPPGHDAWTVGDEPCVMLDFSGMERYAMQAGKPRMTEEQPAVP